MGSPHVLILPFPAQGHVVPLMELSHCLADHGFEVTVVNTNCNHDRIIASLSQRGSEIDQMIHLVPIPDGLASGEDRNDFGRLCEGMLAVMPRYLEELVRKTNESRGNRITWMIADQNMAWAFKVAKKMDIQAAAFWPAASALLATTMSIPKLIQDGILNVNGLPERHEMFQLSPGMPLLDTTQFAWNCIGDSKAQKIIFQYIVNNIEATKLAKFIISNSFYELEAPVFAYTPNILPVGPLIIDQRQSKSFGNFWPEDAACISWLDQQPVSSVIYVAFGSTTMLDQHQFQELSLGLELCDRPFLLVVRPDLTKMKNNTYPDELCDRVAGRGRIVNWSPQQKVLAHPSIACFLSHCGWNSTIEGVRNGVPFLCWPYFTDQFLNQNYICDIWKVGLKMTPDDSGVISREQIKANVEKLLGDGELRARSLLLKEMANNSVREGGSSYKNFDSFVNAMK